MKNTIRILVIQGLLMAPILSVFAQNKPDLTQVKNETEWTLHNRNISQRDGEVHLDGQSGDGLLWLNNSNFVSGTIEVDLKGENKPGQSFVGIAFHIMNDSTYDVVYFRPFNFKNPDRNNHSVQYISHPTYTWRKLRTEFPEKYENPLTPVPNPDDWFHAKIEFDYPSVKVYVNNSSEPSLVIDQISKHKEGVIGFWTGHNSQGWFRNLKIN